MPLNEPSPRFVLTQSVPDYEGAGEPPAQGAAKSSAHGAGASVGIKYPAIVKELEPPVLIGIAVIAVIGVLGLCALFLHLWRVRTNVKATERKIGAALDIRGLRLKDAPAEIKKIEFLMSNLIDRNKKLEEQFSAATKERQPTEVRADWKGAMVVADCLEDAMQSANALQHDPDFQLVDKTLGLVSGLSDCMQALRALPNDKEFSAAFVGLLERGSLDPVLTTCSFLEAYFVDRSAWRRVRIATRAAEALVTFLLEASEVQIVPATILSVVGPSDVANCNKLDRREIRQIPAVQQRAARIARDLGPNQLLVVDYHGPGWISGRIGSRAPSLALFDRASWT